MNKFNYFVILLINIPSPTVIFFKFKKKLIPIDCVNFSTFLCFTRRWAFLMLPGDICLEFVFHSHIQPYLMMKRFFFQWLNIRGVWRQFKLFNVFESFLVCWIIIRFTESEWILTWIYIIINWNLVWTIRETTCIKAYSNALYLSWRQDYIT